MHGVRVFSLALALAGAIARAQDPSWLEQPPSLWPWERRDVGFRQMHRVYTANTIPARVKVHAFAAGRPLAGSINEPEPERARTGTLPGTPFAPLFEPAGNLKVKPPQLGSEQIRELGPPCYEALARPEWTDRNQHVNIRYFIALFDDAGDAFYATVGFGDADHRGRQSGTMDLEHHTHFIRELRPGDRISVYLRIVGVSAKRFHYLMFLLNDSTREVASIFECVNTFVDLTRRKSAPWPEQTRAALQLLLDTHVRLPWPAPVCGSMSA